MKYLRLYYRDKNVFIDTTDKNLINNLKIPFEFKDKKYKEKLSYMNKPILDIGSYLYCNYDDYGLGRVTKMFDSDDTLMLVLFEERDLPTMCDRKKLTTVHDEVNRKLKLIL